MSLEGNNKPCYYCGKPCNSLAGDPSKWPIPLCHSDDPGKVKWHHIGCVSERLEQLAALQLKYDILVKSVGGDHASCKTIIANTDGGLKC
jgi:hypothetical protein